MSWQLKNDVISLPLRKVVRTWKWKSKNDRGPASPPTRAQLRRMLVVTSGSDDEEMPEEEGKLDRAELDALGEELAIEEDRLQVQVSSKHTSTFAAHMAYTIKSPGRCLGYCMPCDAAVWIQFAPQYTPQIVIAHHITA